MAETMKMSMDEKNRLSLSIQTLEGLRITGKFSAFGILFQRKSAKIILLVGVYTEKKWSSVNQCSFSRLKFIPVETACK